MDTNTAAPKTSNRPTPQHVPIDDLVVTDLHSFPVDVGRLAQMCEDFNAGAPWAWHPIAVVKSVGGYTILDGRLRAIVRQQAGQITVPGLVYDLIEDEYAAFRYTGNKNRHTRPEVAS